MPLDIFQTRQAGGDVAGFTMTQPGWGPGLDPSFFDNLGEALLTNNRVARDIRIGRGAYDSVQGWIDRFEQVTGYAPQNPELAPEPIIGELSSRAALYEKLAKVYETEKRNRPDLALPPPPTAEDARAAGIGSERERLAAGARRAQAPQGLIEQFGGVVGSMAGVALDPINLGSMAITVPTGAGILSTALRVGLIGGVSQLAISASDFGTRQEIDPNFGVTDAAGEVASAFVGGAVLGGGLKGLARLWGRVVKSGLAQPSATPDAAPAAPQPGYIRFYHGTSFDDVSGFSGKTFVSPQYEYARDYRGGPNNVFYTDLTRQEAIDFGLYDEINNYPRNGAIDDGAGRLKMFSRAANSPQPVPRYVRDAGNVVEREAAGAQANPYRGGGIEGQDAHARNLAEAEAAAVDGRVPQIPDDQFAAGTWRPAKVYASDGMEVGVRYEVVEADSLVASQRPDLSADPRYPVELQPRDRSRAASTEQVNEIAARLNPERLGPSPDASTGAPVVGPDNIVESGNGRWLGLKGAYSRDGAPGYRDHLRALGFEVDGMREPVLIARRVTPLSDAERIAFANAANRGTTLRLSAPEQALSDARLIDTPVLDKLNPEAALAAAENRPFVKAMLGKLPQAERGGLIDRRGNLSAEGIRRVEAAMLARAYGDPALLSRMLESPDSGIKAIGGALTDGAGPWANLRDAVSRGNVAAGMDITADLMDAVRLVERARDTRAKLSALVDQAEMFDAPSPATRALLGLMFRDDALTRAASRASVARGLAAYAEEAMKNTTEARLFGEPLSADDVLTAALAKVGRDDLGVAAREATVPERARDLSTDPTVDDAVLHRLEQLQEDAPDAMIADPEGTLNADGTPKMVSVKSLVDEADAEIKAAQEIEACATPMGEDNG